MTARYAIYFAPASDTAWGRFGAAWLGRCAFGGETPPLVAEGVDAETLRAATEAPRRYGFHATLKPPFRLASGTRVEELVRSVTRLCTGLAAFRLTKLEVTLLGNFLALVPEPADPRLDRLAALCLRELDGFRASPSAAESRRRRSVPLSTRERELLDRWGYPYVLDRFRFHFSLTGNVADDTSAAAQLTRAAADALSAADAGPMEVDAVSIFEEPAPGASLRVLCRVPFGHRGRLVYVVGPSGAGKDAVLAWAQERLRGSAAVCFARRTITRAPSASGEQHHSVSTSEFEALRSRGEFAMTWQANGCWYGVNRSVREWLAEGKTVVVNGSRDHVPRVQAEFPQLEVVHLTAPAALLRARLTMRGREDGSQIAQRLARHASWRAPDALPVTEISNDRDIGAAGAALHRLLAS